MEKITYEEFINNILDTRGRFACGEEYHETHHITPKCMGGTNDEDNLIDLFAREHFEAHRLLALENPENDKLTYAWLAMSTLKNEYEKRYKLTAEEYEEARKAFSMIRKGKPAHNKGVPATDEQKKKQSKIMKEKYIGNNNPFYGKTHTEESREKIRKFAMNRPQEINEKISNSLKGKFVGENNPNYGNHKLAGKNNPNYGKGSCVIQLSLDGSCLAEYISSHEAQIVTGVDDSSIRQCCNTNHKRKTAGGFKWMYKENYEKLKQQPS